ncbi:type 2 periplasmic-binding domain-containing protein [Paraburkholderia acidiphila]|uniref:LysR substrate-binding domain-containing protein n=1 Tax=Paraburkholderia acidiphila TaxID=2571747 RepID=UPI001E4A8B16|nr:LysR substrate-binding domain-containing protein [Paraburkholderia acidiphila]
MDPETRKKTVDAIDLHEGGRKVSVSPMSSMEGNEVLLRAAALNGTGIATLPETMVREDIDMGHLVHVLPECTTSAARAIIQSLRGRYVSRIAQLDIRWQYCL